MISNNEEITILANEVIYISDPTYRLGVIKILIKNTEGDKKSFFINEIKKVLNETKTLKKVISNYKQAKY